MARRHICDTPGCGRAREKWMRLCVRCFTGFPDSAALVRAWKFDRPAWRRLKRAAGLWLAGKEEVLR